MLAIDETEAVVVRRIFDLALGRAGMPLGVKAIVNQLNEAGCQHHGKPFHISSVYRILTSTTYTGIHHFNRREARTGRSKAAERWIMVAVPQIIATEDFEQVQTSLRSRSPRRVPPRLVGSPTLLTSKPAKPRPNGATCSKPRAPRAEQSSPRTASPASPPRSVTPCRATTRASAKPTCACPSIR